VELLAEGRMAEVYALDEDTVLKLDRPEWSGVSEFELEVINRVVAAGLPAARAHGMMTVDGRRGVVLDRVHGRSLQAELTDASNERIDHWAAQFAHLQRRINHTTVEGLPDLVTRLGAEIAQSGLAPDLTARLGALDNGHRGICHFDFHPNNVMVDADGHWVVIDWLTAASGPGLADRARTLVLRGQVEDGPLAAFMRRVLAESGAATDALDGWVRIVAAARLAEGFEGDYAVWLQTVTADGVTALYT
jgi:Ser/Thr protein kinase RdoA (MazF antagonist)